MIKQRGVIRTGILALILFVIQQNLNSQQGSDNTARALYIFDLSEYIEYGPGFADTANFKIGVLSGDPDLIHELGNLAKTRTKIHNKPVVIVGFGNIDSISHTQVLYLNKNSGHSIERVKSKIQGHQTMLITEGYEFRESMINFTVVNNKPQYDINEELIENAGMSVSPGLLLMAIKTREDREIQRQKFLLDSLDKAIILREKILEEKQKALDSRLSKIRMLQKEISVQKKLISDQRHEIIAQKDTIENQRENIDSQLSVIDEQEKIITDQENKIILQLETLEKQKLILFSSLLSLVLAGLLVYFIFRSIRIKKDADIEREENNRTIFMQRDEIAQQHDLALVQSDRIAYQKKNITDSIEYARRIQKALMPSPELISDQLEHFVLYKPLDIVSGDFYWVSSYENRQVIIAADCTGHGIPGAFMSILGITMLNEIVNGKHILMPDQIIENLRYEIIRSLNQRDDTEQVKDGMDIAVCTVDPDHNILWYAGANNPLYLIRGTELRHYRPDKMPVSIHYRMRPFTLHKIDLCKGDIFYIFSDGYADQMGGNHKKKFMSVRLRETLMSINMLPMLRQGERLNQIFEEWRGNNPQVDDVTLIGVRY